MTYPLGIAFAVLASALLGCGRSGTPAVSSSGDIPHLFIAKDNWRKVAAFPDWRTSSPTDAVAGWWHPKLGTFELVQLTFVPEGSGGLRWRFERSVKDTDWITHTETEDFLLRYGDTKSTKLFGAYDVTAYYRPTATPELCSRHMRSTLKCNTC